MDKVISMLVLSMVTSCGHVSANAIPPMKFKPVPPVPTTAIAPIKVKGTIKTPNPILTKSEQMRLINQIFPSDCGIENKKKFQKGRRRKKRVVGGKPATQGQLPWQIALLYNKKHYCGGSIIHKRYIVTGAHCFNPYTSSKPEDWEVRAGKHRLYDIDDYEVKAEVENITIHENYLSMWFEGITDTPPKNDIAIIRLKKPLNFSTSHIKPICLLRPSSDFDWGTNCTVSGWGHLQWNGSQPNFLNYANVPLVSYKDCNHEKAYNGTIHDTALCAGYKVGKTDACEYDSGGPLSCPKCGRHYLTGVVSWGHECARPYKYGVYANMKALTPWLINQISKEESSTSKHVRSG